jgi:hypothetical protein
MIQINRARERVQARGERGCGRNRPGMPTEIVGRNGENESARRAAKGALREVGKLILTISLDELIAMPRGWDAGEDPNNVLIEKLDDLLTDLGR